MDRSSPVSNLRGGLHLPNIPVSFLDPDREQWRYTKQPVHRIPHLPLGRLHALDDVEVYILFPQLFHPSRDHGLITQDEFTTWIDDIFLPALHHTYPSTEPGTSNGRGCTATRDRRLLGDNHAAGRTSIP